MSSKNSPAKKKTLGMIKGKPITTSVPVIHYHASDDEIEELYPSTDDEKQIPDDGEGNESKSDKRSGSNENLSEGKETPSDPWKMLSEIKGKITKTFEEKISEIKNEKKKRKRSRETPSVSDSEDLVDVTPMEETALEKQDNESHSPVLRRRSDSSRFVSFSYIKTGLKDKKSEYSVESGIEAFEEIDSKIDTIKPNFKDDDSSLTRIGKTFTETVQYFISPVTPAQTESDKLYARFKSQAIYHLCLSLFVMLCCYVFPLPRYITGMCAGIFITITVQKIYKSANMMLVAPAKPLPVLEIPAVKEHAVVEKFEGWVNELPYNYDSENYHVARTKSVFFIMEGDILQVMETRTKIPKRAVWDEPKHKPKFTKKRVYSLNGIKVELLPPGLIRRRRWSKKYPICVTFGKEALKESTLIENSSDDEMPQADAENEKVIVEEEETDEELSQSKDFKDVFEDCRDDEDDIKTKMFIFARTDRQKEDWFRRLSAAAEHDSKRSSISSTKDSLCTSSSTLLNISSDLKNSSPSPISPELTPTLSYNSYMARYIDGNNQSTNSTADASISSTSELDAAWVNALFGRILFDMHKCPETINVIQDRIQRKLANIKLPYFMESLLVSELVIGQGAPVIHSATKPTMDERGLWFDLEISYGGSLTMTIETKLNLMKLKRTRSTSMNDLSAADRNTPARSPMFDSDVEDSPETSTEDEDSLSLAPSISPRESTPTQSSGRKFLNMVDKLASNKYFQHATELSYVRRAMEGVSNTEIRLMVSVSSIEGCLAVNLPPPPSDRLWYGFRPVPRITLTAKPALGERAVNINYVTKWIETKLLKEFEKIVVIPNMDDLVVPLCPNYPYDIQN